MTNIAQTPPPPPYMPPTEPQAPQKSTNVLGLIALAAAVLGTILACIPGVVVIGWILLPVSFILGIVALFQKGRAKWSGVTAICVSVVGTIIAIVVAITFTLGAVAGAVEESFSEGDTTISAPADDVAVDEEAEEAPEEEAEPAAPAGTRDAPLAFDSVIENDDWTFSFTAFTPDGNETVAAANQFNEAPGDGQVYVIVDASATYQGADEGNSMMVAVDYVTADGTVISSWDSMAAGVDPSFGQASLYAGAADEGKLVFLVPASLDGLLRVTPGMFADDLFVSLPK